MLLGKRPRDDDDHSGFTKWPFMTTQTWAENPRGQWKLRVKFDSPDLQVRLGFYLFMAYELT